MVQKQQDGELEIDLLQMARLLVSKWLIILIATVLCGVLVLVGTFLFVTPKYEASTTWYVNNSTKTDSTAITSADLTASAKLVDTYKAIITSRTVLDKVISESGVNVTYSKLVKRISTKTVNSSEVFNIIVEDTDPKTAALIANTLAEVAPDEIADIVSGSSVKIIDWAVTPKVQSSPSYPRALLIGALIGFVLACAFFVIRELFDTSIKSEADFAQFNYPLLSTIPDLAQAKKNAEDGYGYGYGARRSGSK